MYKRQAYWRASNYLAAGQLYLLDNPMLRRPLTRDDVKKKIVGHSTYIGILLRIVKIINDL